MFGDNVNRFLTRFTAVRYISRRAAVAVLLLATTGCGITYTSPSVRDNDPDVAVNVIELTPQTVAAANQSTYSPRSLPEVFHAVAGGGSQIGAGALPAAPYVPDARRERLDLRPLPDVSPEPYKIGVGDVLLLATRGGGTTVEQLSGLLAAQNQRQGYTVRDDGSIAIPDVGQVLLVGMTVKEAEDKLFQVLVENQMDPSFSLEVADFNSKSVVIGGAVKSPGLVPITLKPLTLGDALAVSGGINVRDKEFASIRIYRDGTLYQIPLDNFFKKQDLQNKILLSGDAVFVDTTYDLDRAMEFYRQKLDVISLRSSARGDSLNALQSEISIQRDALNERRSNFTARSSFDGEVRDYVYLTGEVKKQSRFPLPYERQATLADVLYSEGGFNTETGNAAQIYVLRATPGTVDGQISAYHLNAKNAANIIIATRMQMRPNDVIFIEEQPITKWNRSLQQLFPILLSSAKSSI